MAKLSLEELINTRRETLKSLDEVNISNIYVNRQEKATNEVLNKFKIM